MSRSKGCVVVLDDSRPVLNQISLQLAAAGFEAHPTTDVLAAAQLLATADLVIVDYYMGDLTGFDAIKILRKAAQASKSSCRFYLYTTDQECAHKALDNGFDGAFSVKGNIDGLVRQVVPAVRASQVRARLTANGLLKS